MNEIVFDPYLLDENGQPLITDWGHRGDFDYTQIRAQLAMTPTERLRHHESWRLFVKEALNNARLRQNRAHEADRRPS